MNKIFDKMRIRQIAGACFGLLNVCGAWPTGKGRTTVISGSLGIYFLSRGKPEGRR